MRYHWRNDHEPREGTDRDVSHGKTRTQVIWKLSRPQVGSGSSVRWGLLVIGKSVQLVGHPALSLSLSQLGNSL